MRINVTHISEHNGRSDWHDQVTIMYSHHGYANCINNTIHTNKIKHYQ